MGVNMVVIPRKYHSHSYEMQDPPSSHHFLDSRLGGLTLLLSHQDWGGHGHLLISGTTAAAPALFLSHQDGRGHGHLLGSR